MDNLMWILHPRCSLGIFEHRLKFRTIIVLYAYLVAKTCWVNKAITKWNCLHILKYLRKELVLNTEDDYYLKK